MLGTIVICKNCSKRVPLTFGKRYKVLDVWITTPQNTVTYQDYKTTHAWKNTSITVLADDGHQWRFPLDRFVTIKELRKQKIRRCLEKEI